MHGEHGVAFAELKLFLDPYQEQSLFRYMHNVKRRISEKQG